MADDQRRNPDDPWVAPPLDATGGGLPSYQDPFAQQATAPIPPPYAQGYATPPPSIPPQPYGAPAYGAPMPPYGASRADKNWMGITSLVLSLLGISLIGVILGHLGLGAVKRGEANNRGIALAGTIVGWVGMVLGLLGIVLSIAIPVYLTQSGLSNEDATSSFTWESTTPEPTESAEAEDPYADLAQPGDGVFGLAEANEYLVLFVNGTATAGTCLTPSFTSGYDVDVVDCAEPHVGEVYLAVPVADIITDGDLGSEGSAAELTYACSAALEPYADLVEAEGLGRWLFAASDDGEYTLDDTLLCVTSIDFTETTGSLLTGVGGTVY